MAADRRPMPCPADRCPVPPSNMPKRKKTTPQLHGPLAPCRAVPYQTENAVMHAPVVHPFHAMLPTDRPNFVYRTHTKRKQKQTNKKRGWERERNPYDAVPSRPPPVRQKQKKKGSCRRCQTASHMTMHSLSGTPPSLASLASLGSLGSFFALRVLLLPLPPWLLDFDRSFL